MTVRQSKGVTVTCTWFRGDNEPCDADFNENQLNAVGAPQPSKDKVMTAVVRPKAKKKKAKAAPAP